MNSGILNIGLISRKAKNSYKLFTVSWNQKEFKCKTTTVVGDSTELAKLSCANVIHFVNCTLGINNRFYIKNVKNKQDALRLVVENTRKIFENTYGTETDLAGHCIQASEMLMELLRYMGFKCKTVEGWCEFDDEYYGSDRPYDPHTWLEVDISKEKPLYVDITADQFNRGMYVENDYPGVIINIGLPHGMSYSEPVIYED